MAFLGWPEIIVLIIFWVVWVIGVGAIGVGIYLATRDRDDGGE